MRHDIDELLLERALELAEAGRGLTSPNPCVGAVVVDDGGTIVGTGSHSFEGVKHAEVLALEQAGEKARGATLYVNLEPCSHTGRTGPCTAAIIAAGLRRVVSAVQDPNPLVSGRGLQQLRDAGITVVEGVLEEKAKQLNESFARYIRRHIPLVTLKAAMTLDGKIAPPPRTRERPATLWITGESARAHAHRLRHASDAILVGVGTVIADDPLLTDRSGQPRRRRLLRIVLDSELRLPVSSRVVETAENDVLVLCTSDDQRRRQELTDRGVRVERLSPAPDGRPSLKEVLAHVGGLEITSLLIEGGAQVNGEALAEGVVDKVFFYYAPTILGGLAAVPLATGRGFQSIDDAPRVHPFRLHTFGQDFALEGYLKDPYAD
jgi:diaminohydroxyphosphoribosylaminopyrimidine deaminase/5-amino-6-(5-phosphoribosylamino)uracil reductase